MVKSAFFYVKVKKRQNPKPLAFSFKLIHYILLFFFIQVIFFCYGCSSRLFPLKPDKGIMLQKLRKPFQTKNIAYYLVFGMVCLVFVFIGVPLGQQSSTAGSAFTVNNQIISWLEYQNHVEMIKASDSGASGQEEKVKKQAVDTLMNAELINQQAGYLSLHPAQSEIRDKILTLPLFQKEGRFTHSLYRSFLSARRLKPAYFENLIRKEIQGAFFQNMFNGAFPVSKAEKEKRRWLKSLKAEVSYIEFSELKTEELSRLKGLLRKGSKLKPFMKQKNWEWEKTGAFDLSQTFLPGLNEHKKLFDSVFNHLPETGLIKNIISIRDRSFILRVDSFTRATKEEMLPEYFLASVLSARLNFLSWLKAVRAKAKLKFHPRLQTSLSSED